MLKIDGQRDIFGITFRQIRLGKNGTWSSHNAPWNPTGFTLYRLLVVVQKRNRMTYCCLTTVTKTTWPRTVEVKANEKNHCHKRKKILRDLTLSLLSFILWQYLSGPLVPQVCVVWKDFPTAIFSNFGVQYFAVFPSIHSLTPALRLRCGRNFFNLKDIFDCW